MNDSNVNTFIDYSNFKGTNRTAAYPLDVAHQDYIEYRWDSIHGPQIIEYFSILDSTQFYNTRFFIRPGDTITMHLQKEGIRFEGEKVAQFDFFLQLDPLSNEWSSIKYQGSLTAYKAQADSIYKRRQTFFENYVSKHDLPQDFVSMVGDELMFEYLYNLMVPRQADELSEYNINSKNMVNLIGNGWGNDNEILFDFDSYFEKVTLEDFKRPELLSNDYFKRSLVEFILFYFVHNEPITFSLDNFEKEKKFIEDNFEGALEEFAITSLYYDYYNKGYGQGKKEKSILASKLEKQRSKFNDPKLKTVLVDLEERLSTIGSSFFKRQNQDMFVTISTDTLSINTILNNTPQTLFVLDFWASWCAPCIKEIKESVTLRASLEQESKVRWIFISVDGEEEKWKVMIDKLNPYTNSNQNHYRLIDYHNASTIRYLSKGQSNLFLIPRYVILDENLEIIYSQAPRPSNSIAFKKLIQSVMQKK